MILGSVAWINERGSTMDCVVRNISEGGACVEFDAAETAKLPDQINLTIARKGRSFLARMIWRHAGKVGLAFRVMAGSGAPADLDERLRRSERKKRLLQHRIRELLGEG